MSKDIQLMGSSQNNYIHKEKKETFTNPKVSKQQRSKLLLYPKSEFLKYWSLLLLLTLLYTLTFTPFLVCFTDTLSGPFDSLNLTVDMIFFADIMINFNLAYVDKEGILVDKRSLIIKNY